CNGNQTRVSSLGEIHILSWDQKHGSRLNSRTRRFTGKPKHCSDCFGFCVKLVRL
ncbi:unnamed protein product, partial [Porites evermanni]